MGAIMSTDQIETTDTPGPTKPQKEHEWLQQLVGEWNVTSEMMMPAMESMAMTAIAIPYNPPHA